MRYTAVIEHHASCTADAKRRFRNRVHSISAVVVRENVRNVNRHHYTRIRIGRVHTETRVITAEPKLGARRQNCNIIRVFFFPV